MNPKSSDQILRRAVARLCDRQNGDSKAILRIMDKARNLRTRRAVAEMIGAMRRPLPPNFNADRETAA